MARLVEVWDYFRAPMSENDMIRMRRTFSIINLDKCTFEFQLPPRWPEGGTVCNCFLLQEEDDPQGRVQHYESSKGKT